MALSDWNIYKIDAGGVAAIDTTAPLVGGGSLLLHRGSMAGAAEGRENLVSKGVTYTPVGVLRGALAGTFQVPASFTLDNAQTQYAGILALQSSASMTATGACWALLFGATAAGGITTLSVRYFTGGLSHAALPAALWSHTLTPAIALGTLFTLEFEWAASAEYGGVRYIVRRGSATNYSDLTQLVDQIDTTHGVPSTSLGEGPCLLNSTNAAVNYQCRIDQWRLRA
jgi:hypothetical protein